MSRFEICDKADIAILEAEKHFISNPHHPRLIDISGTMKQSALGPHEWLFYMENMEGAKDQWYEVLEINLVIDEHGFHGDEEETLHKICDSVFPETKLSVSGYFAEPAYIAGARFSNGSYTVRLHRECGFKEQSHNDYIAYKWELQ